MDELAQIFRAESGKVIASLVCFSQDMQLAEDALQDAFEQASIHWPVNGVPENSGAWLHIVAKRKLIDRLRRTMPQCDQKKLDLIEQNMYTQNEVSELDYEIPDERLRLIFTCCHPALNQASQVALTLRTLCGLNIKEIARAYLISEVTMGQRITRAKKKIKLAGIAYEIPSHEQLGVRLASALKVIYLIYNESYNAYEGLTLTRQELAQEAVRLSQLMVALIPCAEVYGMAALLLFHDARRASRSSHSESYIPLEKQNRGLWDVGMIEEGNSFMRQALACRQTGAYQIQAAISALHCSAKSWDATDWNQIHLLYLRLLSFVSSPVVKLNLMVAKANAGELEKAYGEVLLLETELVNYQPYHAARSELESRLKLIAEASVSLEKAIKLSKNDSERDFLLRKREELSKN